MPKAKKTQPKKGAEKRPAGPVKAKTFEPAARTWESQIDRFFDRLLGDFQRRWPSLWRGEHWPSGLTLASPVVDVYEEGTDVVVTAELPGMAKDDVNLVVADHVLTIKGQKKKEEEVKKEDYYRWERSYGSFARSVELPAEVRADGASATFKDGVLTVRLPKMEEAKQKRIKVNVD